MLKGMRRDQHSETQTNEKGCPRESGIGEGVSWSKVNVDQNAAWLNAFTPAERALLVRIANVNVHSARRVTVFTSLIGVLLGAGLLIVGVLSGDVTYRHAGIFCLMLTPVMAIVRGRVLDLYVLISKLLCELQRIQR